MNSTTAEIPCALQTGCERFVWSYDRQVTSHARRLRRQEPQATTSTANLEWAQEVNRSW